MCLIAFAIDAVPGCPLLLAGNRDEFFDRPTEPLHRWTLPNGTAVWAGRDGRDGGTWLGVSEAGRVALLTNIRSAHAGSGRRSRGELPTQWLGGGLALHDWLATLDPAAYAGFNLVVGDLVQRQWTWIANRHPQAPHEEPSRESPVRFFTCPLRAGLYGLSNAVLDTPWPKTLALREALQQALPQPPDERCERLARALRDGRRSAAEALPQTRVPAELEHGLSSAFVSLPERGYGTRSSLVLQVDETAPDGGWRLRFDEWTHAAGPETPHRWSDTAVRRAMVRVPPPRTERVSPAS